MEAIHTTLDEGGSLSNALAEHPRVFSPLFISVVEVGEHTGRLGPALEQIADILEKEQEAKQKAVKTMMYPLAIIGLSVCTLGVLMTVAMPPMLKIFGQMEADIPVMTRIMVALVGAITGNYREIFLAAVAMAALFVLMGHSPRARLRMDGALARAPLIGPVIRRRGAGPARPHPRHAPGRRCLPLLGVAARHYGMQEPGAEEGL